MNLSECEASSDENKNITEAEDKDEDGTYRKQVKKQKHISI
ncbi:hypothetical protein RDI58_020168 [Solanum bulbocastanum]|uniref:Uncharacterized protein n=1 Tax=Solanum bulbocastanum TaxID=147425 RepID=A0AAN8TC05_SOLBU